MSAMASQITCLTIVYSTVCSGANQIKHQSSASLAFVRETHRWPVISPHKWPVTRKMSTFDDVNIYRTTRLVATRYVKVWQNSCHGNVYKYWQSISGSLVDHMHSPIYLAGNSIHKLWKAHSCHVRWGEKVQFHRTINRLWICRVTYIQFTPFNNIVLLSFHHK